MKKFTKALAVLSMFGGAVFSTQALAEPFKIGICYDLSKAYTFATPQVSQAAMDLAKLINSATRNSAARASLFSIPCPLRCLWLSCRGPWKTGVS